MLLLKSLEPTTAMKFMKQDAKQLGVAQLTCFDDEDDYVNIESDGDCQSSNFGSLILYYKLLVDIVFQYSPLH